MEQLAALPENAADAAPAVRDGWLFGGLLGLLVWAPLPLGSNRTWAVGLLIAWTQCLLWGCAWAWRQAPDAAFARLGRWRWPLGLFAAFVGLLGLQLLPLPGALLGVLSPRAFAVAAGVAPFRLSLDPQQTAIYAAFAWACLSLLVVVLLTVRERRRLAGLARCLVYSGLAQVLLGVALYSAGAHYQLYFANVFHDRLKGSFLYPNQAAAYFELCLALGGGLLLAEAGAAVGGAAGWRQRLARCGEFLLAPAMRLRVVLFVMVLGLVMTGSRMGNGGFFLAVLLLVPLAGGLLARPGRTGVLLLALAASVIIGGTAVGGAFGRLGERWRATALLERDAGREESLELRLDAPRHALDLVADFPWFGSGGGSFYNTYLPYRTARPGYFDHAHNDYVEFAADYGLLGCAPLAAFAALSVWRGLTVLRRRRSRLPRGIAFGALLGLAALAIHGTVDYVLQLPANVLTTVVVIAMLWIAAELPSGRAQRAG